MGPQENVDNDDGSSYYDTHSNFFAYVGQAVGLYDAPMLDGHVDHFTNNKVVLTGSHVGAGTCSGTGKTVLSDNQYFTNSGAITECKVSLADWQKQDPTNDPRSTVPRR